MKPKIEPIIKSFIEQKHKEGKEFVMGGLIEDYMRNFNGTKGETSSRLCRFMVKSGILEPVYVPREKGKANVAYKIKESREVKEEVCRPSQNESQRISGLQMRTLW